MTQPVTYPCSRPVRIPALRRTHWVDVTTHHDLVGRLTVPTLPSGVDEKAVVVTGNAIADHVRYLNKPGITSWLIAEEIAAGLGHLGDPTVEQARQGALARSSRRHDLRAAALAVPLLFVGTMALTFGGDPMNAMVGAIPSLIWVFLLLTLFVWIADTRDSRQVAKTLAGQRGPRLVPPTPEPRRAEVAVLIVVALMAATSTFATYGWLRELNLLPLGDDLLTALMLWTVAGLCLAAAVAAGYRPPPVKVIGLLVGMTLLLAVPAWQSVSPLYPRHFLPLGLPAIVALPMLSFAALTGFNPLLARIRQFGRRLKLGLPRV